MSLLVYFPKDQFSPRYGDKFYTMNVSGFSICGVDDTLDGGESASTADHCKTMLTTTPCSTKSTSHVEYHVTIRQGNAQWTVNHRFRAFLEMHESLRKEITSQNYPVHLPVFPQKTWFTVLHDEHFLDTRRVQLEVYLHSVLTDLSRKGLVLPFSLATFLQINPIAP